MTIPGRAVGLPRAVPCVIIYYAAAYFKDLKCRPLTHVAFTSHLLFLLLRVFLGSLLPPILGLGALKQGLCCAREASTTQPGEPIRDLLKL